MTKALSIRQPWAWAILCAGKDIENRRWSTKVRGRVLVHAAKAMTNADFDECMYLLDEITPVSPSLQLRRRASSLNSDEARRGGIIGSIEIVDCVSDSASPWFFGRYGFLLRNPRPLPFRPLKGRLGFFEVEE